MELTALLEMIGTAIPILLIVVAVAFVGMLAAAAAASIHQFKRNNAAPVQTVDARLISRRVKLHTGGRPAGGLTGQVAGQADTYYATFETAEAGRMEFYLQQSEYTRLKEGDRGKLTFQGSRYLGFARPGDPPDAPDPQSR